MREIAAIIENYMSGRKSDETVKHILSMVIVNKDFSVIPTEAWEREIDAIVLRNIYNRGLKLYDNWYRDPMEQPLVISSTFPFIEQAIDMDEQRLNALGRCPCIKLYLDTIAHTMDLHEYYDVYRKWSHLRSIAYVGGFIMAHDVTPNRNNHGQFFLSPLSSGGSV